MADDIPNWKLKADRLERNAVAIAAVGLLYLWRWPDTGGRPAGGLLLLVAAFMTARCTWIRFTGGK